jgi:hypothetical protein
MKIKRRGSIRIKRSKSTGLVIAIVLILAAALFSAQINPQPTGLAPQPVNIPSSNYVLCKVSLQSPNAYGTTKSHCCGSDKYNNYLANSKIGNRYYKLSNEEWKAC